MHAGREPGYYSSVISRAMGDDEWMVYGEVWYVPSRTLVQRIACRIARTPETQLVWRGPWHRVVDDRKREGVEFQRVVEAARFEADAEAQVLRDEEKAWNS